MKFKFKNKLTNKEFWNIYSKSFLFLEISFLILQILTWEYPINNYGKPRNPNVNAPFAIGRRADEFSPYIADGEFYHSVLIFISIIIFLPFLYTLIRRRVRDMGIDTFFAYIFYLPLSSLSVIAISSLFVNVQVFLDQCCSGAWIDNVYYNEYSVSQSAWVFSDPIHLNSFVVIISLLCIPCLIMIRTKD